MDLIKCRFLDTNKEPKGRAYTYVAADRNTTVGDIVTVQNNKYLIVTEINVPIEEIKGFEDKLKYVSKVKEDSDENNSIEEDSDK